MARHSLIAFLILTFGISLLAGGAAFAIGGRGTFESLQALPALLITIWAPNLAAIAVLASQGRLGAIRDMLSGTSSALAWAVALLPIAVAVVLAWRGTQLATVPVGTLALLGAMNLCMGPLGEELGWRGFLLPALVPRLGSVGAALAVGTLWAIWHAPLWWLPSPQSAIPFPTFFGTVLCFSLIMTVAWQAGSPSLWPLVLFHWGANVGVGWLELSETMPAREAYRVGLPYYAACALAAALWLAWQTRDACSVELTGG